MYNRLEERTKGYYGQIVSGAKLAVIAKQIYALQYNNPTEEVGVEDLLVIQLKEQNWKGDYKTAVVCTEGVGWEEDEYGTISVPTNVGEFGIYNGRVHISVDVINSCLTNEIADIAYYVRVFGDRLDRNVAIWQSAMNKQTELKLSHIERQFIDA